MTFSIVAFDPKTKDLGVAVESKFVAVGVAVPWARAGVGAIATQSYANTTFGPRGLRMLKRGSSPKDTLRRLLARDSGAATRQIGIVDGRGRAAAFTGDGCHAWAGHVVGRGYACQGNILAGEKVVASMARAFRTTGGDLPERLLAALQAGQAAGGDRRGQQSAALLVVREGGGYAGLNDRWIDIRVDEHPRPIDELARVFGIYDMTLLNRDDPSDVVRMDGRRTRELQTILRRLGTYTGEVTGRYDAATRKALEDWMGIENLENRVRKDGRVWGSVWRYLRERAGDG